MICGLIHPRNEVKRNREKSQLYIRETRKSATTSQITQFAVTLKFPQALFEFIELENCQKSLSDVTGFLADTSVVGLVLIQFGEIELASSLEFKILAVI